MVVIGCLMMLILIGFVRLNVGLIMVCRLVKLKCCLVMKMLMCRMVGVISKKYYWFICKAVIYIVCECGLKSVVRIILFRYLLYICLFFCVDGFSVNNWFFRCCWWFLMVYWLIILLFVWFWYVKNRVKMCWWLVGIFRILFVCGWRVGLLVNKDGVLMFLFICLINYVLNYLKVVYCWCGVVKIEFLFNSSNLLVGKNKVMIFFYLVFNDLLINVFYCIIFLLI